MTHEQRIAGFLAYLRDQAHRNPSMQADYAKRIAMVEDPFSGYNRPPMRPGQSDGASFDAIKQDALAGIERQFWADHDQEQAMKEQNG